MMALIASTSLVFANAPVTDMREKPSHDSKMASQAYYTECIRVVEEKDDWVKIETCIDRYQGWVEKKTLVEGYGTKPKTVVAKVERLAAHIYDRENTMYGPLLTVPFETRLEVIEQIEGPRGRWIKITLPDGRSAFIQRGDVSLETKLLTLEEMCDFSHAFLGLPYTYGGRSSFGYDCSGFVQMLYRQMGVMLPRDSKDQINWEGFQEIPLDKAKKGDLVFFGLAADSIQHVGLCLGEGRFIHSSPSDNTPYITINKLSEPSWNSSGRYVYRAARTLRE